MALQHCEGVLQWFVPGVSNIAETLFFFIARGVSAFDLQHGEKVSQWFYCLARGSCNGFVLLHCEGGLAMP